MPIYEYRCQDCGHELDALQKMADAPLTDCPECGEPALDKLVSAPSFRLKGSGWYETDFKKDNRRNLADSGDGKKTDGESKKADGESKKADGAGNKAGGKKDADSGQSSGTAKKKEAGGKSTSGGQAA